MSIQAFEKIFKKYYHSLVLFAIKFVKDPEAAEDIVQSLFIRLWDSKSFVYIKHPQSFLYLSVKNACIDYLKSSARTSQVPLTVADENLLTDPDRMLSEEALQEAEKLERLYKLVDKLPTKCKLVFQKVSFEGKSYVIVAEELGISVSMVKKQMVKAYKTIREKY